MVSRTIFTSNTGTIHTKYHRQMLNGGIMDDMVKGPLKKGRIDCHDGTHTFCGQPCSKSNTMAFCNPNIIIPIRESFCVRHKAGSFTHGGGDAHCIFPITGNLTDECTKYILENRSIGHYIGRRGNFIFGISVGLNRMKLDCITVILLILTIGGNQSLPFFGQDMKQYRCF